MICALLDLLFYISVSLGRGLSLKSRDQGGRSSNERAAAWKTHLSVQGTLQAPARIANLNFN